jgi:Ca2+-binding EF-hand superfamily protein
VASADDAASDDVPEPMYRETREQKKKLVETCTAFQSICNRMFQTDKDFCKQADALTDEEGEVASDTIVSFALELKSRLQQRVFAGTDSDKSGFVDFQEFFKMYHNLGVNGDELRAIFDSLDVNKDHKLDREELSMYMAQNFNLFAKKQSQLEQDISPDLANQASLKRRQRSVKLDSLTADVQDTYAILIKVEKLESMLRDIFLEQVLDVAFKMQKEGVITAPPLVSPRKSLQPCLKISRFLYMSEEDV